ncbi:TonB-dependent receptor [Parabacteroides sp. TM07-1AC]|jgi:TonB-linked SusC/RagA family outer membrane protein|uniref:TonB-dependent receptor n=1 Tax=Parabacteroides sp. TM07-1AC TaxID=2292363 RepID=UPI000EFE4D6D|nr:TonB-dependent receptor [Parabacteroides sp. TM07-1AC]RHU29257.1 SusC/RagA family TonB-linked outer membrane protein [Parabacteroides sp. TM07-1AC]
MFKINWKLLPVLVAFGAVNSVYAQAEKLDLSVTNKSLKQFITQVEKETDYTFMLDQTVDQNQKITVKGQQESLETILTKAFAGKPVTFEIVGKQIILKLPRTTQSGQTKKITGTIKDENGEAVIGANVSVKGTTTGTITDIDGNFSLEAQQGATLLISYIGYETQEITVGSQSVYSIRLSEDSQALDEVVVIGYGTQNRQAITGSITKADIDTYRDVPTNNIMETIKGSVPGLNVGGVNKAGNVAGFSIRGQNSTRDGGNNPLIVLDGAIYDGSLADIPSEDIENFTVLKDASAAAVYGSRSANGVILIQTKRGRSKSSKPEFNVNLSYGISNELKRLKVYDAPGYLQHILDVRQANGLDADPAKIDLYLQAEESKNYNATPDHQPTFSDPYELFRQNAYNLKANVSVSNSSEFASYYISAAMTDQKGVVLNDRYKNFSGRVNIDSNLTSWLKVGVKTNYSIRDYSGSTPSMEKAAQFSPYASLYDEEGRYLQFPQTTTSFQSPFWSMRTDDTEKYNILGAILNGKITVPWVKGLTYEMVYSNTLRWSQKNYFYDEYTTEGQGKNGKGERKNENNYSMLLDNMIKYNNTFNQKHNVDVTLLYSRERRTWDDMTSYAENFDNTVLGDNKLEDGKKQTVNTGAGESGAIAWMARGTYTFDGRYSLTGTVRRDGCSAFSINRKWATFASGGLNWNITNESFMKDVKAIDNLALRVSYGSNGNQSIDSYSTLAKVGTNKYIFAGDPSYSITQGISSFALNDLGWEKTTGANFGVDFSVLNNRLSGSVDAYFTNTTDLLFSLALPSVSGKTSILSNLGKIKNKGVEIGLHSVNIETKDFSWTSDFAFSLNRNKVATIYGEDNDGDGKEDDLISSGYFIGKTLGTIYNYKVNGMWQQSDVDNGTIMEGMRPGDYKLEDVDGDGKISSDKDRQFLGTSKENFRWSLTNTLSYKDFSLMVYINSIWGGNGYFLSGNNTPYTDEYVNSAAHNRTVYDYWTPENTNAKYPRPDYQANARYKGTKYVDRSFIKLQKIALSYDLSRLVKPYGFNNMRLSLSADNLFTFAPHWDGLDPETDSGLKITAFPSIRTYQMTLMFNF